MLEHPFEVCCRLSKIAFFRLIYHSNVMLLTTVLTTFNKPIYLPIYLSSLPRILSFRFFFTHSLSLSFYPPIPFILLYLWQPPSLKMLTMHAEYMLCIILWHWMIDFQDYTHTDDSIPFFLACVCMRVCYGFCNWIQSDFLQFAFVPFLNLLHSLCTGFWRWHLSHFVLQMLMFRYERFSLVRLFNAKKRTKETHTRLGIYGWMDVLFFSFYYCRFSSVFHGLFLIGW